MYFCGGPRLRNARHSGNACVVAYFRGKIKHFTPCGDHIRVEPPAVQSIFKSIFDILEPKCVFNLVWRIKILLTAQNHAEMKKKHIIWVILGTAGGLLK